MKEHRGRRRQAMAFALIALAPLAALASAEPPDELELRLESLDALPSERWSAEVDSGAEIAAVRFAVDGREVDLDRAEPFRSTLRLERPLARPIWVEAIGLDAQGRERARAGRCVHLPDDRSALRIVPTGEREAIVLVEPAAGRRVVRVEGLTAEGTLFATLAEPPYRFALPGPGAWAARVTFDDGRVAAAWDPGRGGGEVVDVRLGQARWLAPADEAPPSVDSIRVLFEGRDQRVLRLVGGAGTGLELGLAVDVSESTGPRFEEVRAAVRDLAAGLIGPADRTLLVTFSQRAELVASSRGDLGRILAAVPSEVRSDRTRLYDGLAYALLQFHADDPRAALVVLTDSCDTTRRPDVARVRALALERSIPIYALLVEQECAKIVSSQDLFGRIRTTFVQDRALTRRGRERLERLAVETGGRVVPLAEGDGVEEALRLILQELEQQWLVVFEPSSERVSSEAVAVRLGETRLP